MIYTEPGGRMEAELASYVTENDSKLPIVAFMAGRFMDEMPGMSFGHAGTIVEGKADTAAEKIKRLTDAGITVAEEISQIPDLVKEKIGGLMPGTFIDVEVADDIRDDAALAQGLEDACPVDIYANRDGRVEVVEDNLDECVLCELCIRGSARPARCAC